MTRFLLAKDCECLLKSLAKGPVFTNTVTRNFYSFGRLAKSMM